MRFEIQTQRREQMVEITREVAGAVTASGVTDGRVMVFCQHTTAAVTINEAADPDVQVDEEEEVQRFRDFLDHVDPSDFMS